MGPTRVRHPLFARFYTRVAGAMEEGGMARQRRELLAGVRGEVVEIGAGNGLNFAHYPAAVTGVTAVEPEPYLRGAAERAAAGATAPITVVDGLAERLPFDGGRFDAAVATLVLCSVSDQYEALREIRRVLRPGGRLYFLEHVRADTAGMRRVQGLLDATVGPRVLGGCRSGRDTTAAIEATGFTVTAMERFLFPEARTPSSFHVRGEAARV